MELISRHVHNENSEDKTLKYWQTYDANDFSVLYPWQFMAGNAELQSC